VKDTREWTFSREYTLSPDTTNAMIVEQPFAREIQAPLNTASDDIVEQLLSSKFLDPPSRDTLNSVISNFIDATGNVALKTVSCGLCRNKCE
jgi:hypothetical protein